MRRIAGSSGGRRSGSRGRWRIRPRSSQSGTCRTRQPASRAPVRNNSSGRRRSRPCGCVRAPARHCHARRSSLCRLSSVANVSITRYQFLHCPSPRIGVCGIRGLPVVGVSKGAGGGPVAFSARGFGSPLCSRSDRGADPCRTVSGCAGATLERAKVLLGCRVPGAGFGRMGGVASRSARCCGRAILVRCIESARISVRVPGGAAGRAWADARPCGSGRHPVVWCGGIDWLSS
ncbi:hypothetical protein R1CP_26310 [Rhodococcus opacus]|uniref:Uncharacterized protein n=1 Tax=Rhodococcus opacus TaxID=37919 RepID=A0A1B1KBD5_RHOOP|nr:hypothetical protein R1CP_26310 [Rhodococcus opacus]